LDDPAATSCWKTRASDRHRSIQCEVWSSRSGIGPTAFLVRDAPTDRVRRFGLAHEIMGEGGMLWSARLCTIDAGLETDGARGFPPMMGQYLAARYGYVKERVAQRNGSTASVGQHPLVESELGLRCARRFEGLIRGVVVLRNM